MRSIIKRRSISQKTIALVTSVIVCAALALIINVGTLTVRADETTDYENRLVEVVAAKIIAVNTLECEI